MQMAFGFAFSIFFLLPKILVLVFHASASENGAVMASFGITSLLAVPLLRPALRRLGGHGVLTAACAVLAASCVGFAFVHSAGIATMALRGVQGIAWSMAFSAGASLVAQHAPKARLAEAIGYYGGASLIMNAIGPALAEPLFERWGAGAVFATAGFSAGWAIYFSRPAPLPRYEREREDHRTDVHADNEQAESVDSSTPVAPAQGPAWPVYLIFLGSGGAFSVIETFIAPFSISRGQLTVRPFFIAFTFAAVAMRVLFARSIDRVGHRRMTVLATGAYGMSVIAIGLLGPLPLAVFGIFFGAAHGLLFPAGMALLLRGRDELSRSHHLAIANSAMNLGIACAVLHGVLAERLGYPVVFALAGTITVATATVLGRVGSADR